jgi:hypothetical protein
LLVSRPGGYRTARLIDVSEIITWISEIGITLVAKTALVGDVEIGAQSA